MSVTYELADGIATITLDSEDGRNRLDDGVTASVIAAVERASTEASGLVLASRATQFSVGGDLGMLPGFADEAATEAGRTRLRQRIRDNARLISLLLDFEGPTIAAVPGACVGAAVGWITACDLRIATPRALVKPSFLSIGLSSDFGTAALLSHTLGRSRALAMLVGGVAVSAEEGVRLGYFVEVTDGGLLDRARAWIAAASAAPWSARALRHNIDGLGGLDALLDAEADRFVEVIGRANEVPAFRELAASQGPTTAALQA